MNGMRSEHEQGVITDAERYNKVIDVWTHTTNDVARVLMEKIKESEHGFNSLHMMVDSGARGSGAGKTACWYARIDDETAEDSYGSGG